jgi:carbamoyltransferase
LKILGICSSSHDAGLAILEDGVPTLIFEEERFNREKHTKRFPAASLDHIFKSGTHKLTDIGAITMPWVRHDFGWTFARILLGGLPGSVHLLRPRANTKQLHFGMVVLSARIQLGLMRYFSTLRLPKLFQIGHHDAHAAIFFISPFENAAVLVTDGYGDVASVSAYAGQGTKLKCLWRNSLLESLGILYAVTTQHLGFEALREEGTVMALAACGGDGYVSAFREIVRLTEDGRYVFDWSYFHYPRYGMLQPFTRKFHDRFGPPRRRDEPLTDRHRDLARALQTTIEEAVLHLARGLRSRTSFRNLCLTGGVALNCVANARILRDSGFERIWVPPCAGDTGAPLGGALWHHHQTLGGPRRFELTHAYFGTEYGDDEIERALRASSLSYEYLTETDLIARVARDLANDKIVGWFQGRYEIGPRALGNRSILASPLKLAIKDKLNARIKDRDAFRPFAPAVLREHAAEYFDIAQDDPFMTLAPHIMPGMMVRIPAVAHVDGTARIQTVARDDNPRFYTLISEFMRLTGVPVVLNTSFNKQEPIVTTPGEAISCFLRTEMDVLVLGNFYSTDRNENAVARARSRFRTRAENLRGSD